DASRIAGWKSAFLAERSAEIRRRRRDNPAQRQRLRMAKPRQHHRRPQIPGLHRRRILSNSGRRAIWGASHIAQCTVWQNTAAQRRASETRLLGARGEVPRHGQTIYPLAVCAIAARTSLADAVPVPRFMMVTEATVLPMRTASSGSPVSANATDAP